MRAGEIHQPVGALPLPVHAVGTDHAPLHRVLARDRVELARDEIELRGDLVVQRLVADGDADAEGLVPGGGQPRCFRGPGDGIEFREAKGTDGQRAIAQQFASGPGQGQCASRVFH